MSSVALIRRDDSRLAVTWTAEAERQRNDAMDLAACVGEVSTPEQQEVAVQAQLAIKQVLNDCEKARKLCKEPVLEFGRTIDASARAFCLLLTAEFERVSAKVRDYQAVLEANRRAAEALRLKELAEIEKRKQEELAKAKTIEEVDQIQERANEETKAAHPPLVVVRAEGQVVREDWDVTIVDIWALAKATPQCVHVEPKMSVIKQLLNAGVRPPGITIKKVINSTVRTGRRSEPLRIGGGE